jgi:hypothetical protein
VSKTTIDRDTLVAFAHGKLTREESILVLTAIESDQGLSRELEEILLLMRGIDDQTTIKHNRLNSLFFEPVLKYVLRIAAALVIGLLSLEGISEASKAKYHDLARVDNDDMRSQWRGSSDQAVEFGRALYLEGKHDSAIERLEQFVRTIPPGEPASVVHWMIGAMLLETAERGTAGLFPYYDSLRVRRAMDHFNFASKSTNPRLIENTQLLRMKALLMLGLPQEAIREGEAYLKTGEVEQSAITDLLRRIGEM